MAFRDFTFPDVCHHLGITFAEAHLFGDVPEAVLQAGFADHIRDGTDLATSINTEKARSEFIIAPVLWELRRAFRGQVGLFSGVALDVDAVRGLNGYCDFLLTRSSQQFVPQAPFMAVVEAKNDNPRTGYGQCIAAMVAAGEVNQQEGTPPAPVYGAVTSGTIWRFLRLEGTHLAIDGQDYFINDLAKIIGIFSSVIVSSHRG